MMVLIGFGLKGPGGWSPVEGHCVLFLGMTLCSLMPLFTQVYEWVLVNSFGRGRMGLGSLCS